MCLVWALCRMAAFRFFLFEFEMSGVSYPPHKKMLFGIFVGVFSRVRFWTVYGARQVRSLRKFRAHPYRTMGPMLGDVDGR